MTQEKVTVTFSLIFVQKDYIQNGFSYSNALTFEILMDTEFECTCMLIEKLSIHVKGNYKKLCFSFSPKTPSVQNI